ncbi:E3 ubiquitin/ISG15 ligase TRIM25-like [Lithobates pipiens]
MGDADLIEELKCSICLSIYTDPVTLTCGHNFCRVCINLALDEQGWSGGYSCPQCRANFKKCPDLQKNTSLANIVKLVLCDPPVQNVFCTQCIHTPVPAVISCLMCEASLCGNHLRVHSKSPEHVLCDPTTSLENRKCSVHKKILEYYCTEDETCICVSCRLDGEHRGHQVETLEEASEMKKKKLRNVLQNLMTKREEMEKRVQSLQERRRKVQGKADGETERVTVLFRDLRRRLEDLEKRVLNEISRQAEWVSISMSDMIWELEIKKEELSRKLRHIEELCNVTDPLTVLRESDTGDLCGAENRNDEDRERHDRLLHDGGDLDMAGVSHTLHTGLSDIMSGVNVEKCIGTHVYPHSTTKSQGNINAEPPRKCPQPTPTIQPSRRCPQPTPTIQPSRRCPQPTPTIQPSRRCPQPTPTIQPSRRCPQPTPTIQPLHCQAGGPFIGSLQQTLGVSGVTDILVDVSRAGNNLHVSDDGKTLTWSLYQSYPETPERFLCPQVMSSQSFSSGRHYWEVDVGGSEFCRVGMCYPSIDRREEHSRVGYNKKSWGLEKLWSNHYSVIHDNNKTRLPGGVSSGRVRIDLDYEAGRISFYDLCDPIRHLHTFTTTFTEPLHAGLGVWEGRITIFGGARCEKSAQKLVTSQGGESDWCNTQPIGGSKTKLHFAT